MNKWPILWLVLVIFGVLFVVLFDQGRGLGSPGIWLVPIGVLGALLTIVISGKRTTLLMPLIIVWLLALFSILGLYHGWFTEGFDGFIWLIPAALFTLAGIVLLIIAVIKNLKR